jgi:adenylate cyclase
MQSIKILSVDDEPDVESLLTQSFRKHIRSGEFEFVFAYDGLEALKRLEEQRRLDVILLDINMPVMDGLTFLAQLNKTGSDLRVIMVSAYGDMSNIRLSMNRGAYDFIMKPVDMTDLETTIRKTAAEVRRYRVLQEQKSAAERCRRNLSRYFSPKMADILSNQDEPLGPVRRQEVTIIFADLVGFTQIAETSSPEEVIELLRGFHSRMSGIIFDHGGTIEKYIGDAVCAAFGVPDTADTDAERAVMCVMEMCGALDRWNRERVEEGDTALQMGVGINSGPAVLGDIGVNHSMSFAVIGHTVNVASRLQSLTRDLQTAILISDSTAQAVRHSGTADAAKILQTLSDSSELAIRGSAQSARVWYNQARYPLAASTSGVGPSVLAEALV